MLLASFAYEVHLSADDCSCVCNHLKLLAYGWMGMDNLCVPDTRGVRSGVSPGWAKNIIDLFHGVTLYSSKEEIKRVCMYACMYVCMYVCSFMAWRGRHFEFALS